jgi:hypothetical protein
MISAPALRDKQVLNICNGRFWPSDIRKYLLDHVKIVVNQTLSDSYCKLFSPNDKPTDAGDLTSCALCAFARVYIFSLFPDARLGSTDKKPESAFELI